MPLKSIVLVASGEREDADTVAAGAALAARTGAQLRIIPAFPDAAADLVYYGAAFSRNDTAALRIQRAEHETQEQLEALARDAASQAGLKINGDLGGQGVVVEKRDLMPAIAVAEAAVLSDLVIFGAGAARNMRALGAIFAETLLSTRAPVLLAKDKHVALNGVAIAWDGSAQAGRAVRASLPLLAYAKEVVIVQNNEDLGLGELDRARADRLISYLHRNGVTKTRFIRAEGENVAQSLIKSARAEGCDMLVAGAYGRPRLYELALGGTTRALVNAQAPLHILLAH